MVNISKIKKLIDNSRNSILLETLESNSNSKQTNLFFSNPLKILKFKLNDDLISFFNEIENYISSGFYIAGYFTYEFGFLFEDRLKGFLSKDNNQVLACFGVYENVSLLKQENSSKQVSLTNSIDNIKLNIKETEYDNNIDKIKSYLESGDVYQINYTCRQSFDYEEDYIDLYNRLRHLQPVGYSALINFDDNKILSFSPELFFSLKGRKINIKPMKGTIKRGFNLAQDEQNKTFLSNDIKNQSENIMIVDLIRNDISKICKPGTVKVNSLFDIEKYKTLFQMTSSVSGVFKSDISYYDIFKSVFPCGSVTGAPKIRAMEIIKELEKEPRGIYTGAIGYFSPKKEACFNVAIRTAILDDKNKKGVMGIGSGIVHDSIKSDEYQECRLKSDFIKNDYIDFQLIETILYNKRYFLLSLHLDRLKASAIYFNFKFNKTKIVKELKVLSGKFDKDKLYKIRLLLFKDGNFTIKFNKIKKQENKKCYISLSEKTVDKSNIFLYHKTTNRVFYNSEYKKAKKNNVFDIIFKNKDGEITEGTITNIILEKDGVLFTPELSSGLLKGVYRQYLLNHSYGKKVQEKIIYERDLRDADKIFVCNSVRGLVRVELS